LFLFIHNFPPISPLSLIHWFSNIPPLQSMPHLPAVSLTAHNRPAGYTYVPHQIHTSVHPAIILPSFYPPAPISDPLAFLRHLGRDGW
jgi:hypothetical protein